MTPSEIYIEAGLTPHEMGEVTASVQADDPDMLISSYAFYKLCDYFSDEMPYGIKKCETGEPDCWILDRLQSV